MKPVSAIRASGFHARNFAVRFGRLQILDGVSYGLVISQIREHRWTSAQLFQERDRLFYRRKRIPLRGESERSAIHPLRNRWNLLPEDAWFRDYPQTAKLSNIA